MPAASPGAFGTPHRVLYGVGAPVGRNAPSFTSLRRLDTKTAELAPDLPGEPSVAIDADGTSWLLCRSSTAAPCTVRI
jgi:hypothetical protein